MMGARADRDIGERAHAVPAAPSGRRFDPGALAAARLKAALPPRSKHAARRAYLRVARLTVAGTGVSCPCCGAGLRRFARFRGVNDQCPRCGSLMRDRVMLLYLRDVMRVPERSDRVLHVAPSYGLQRWLTALDGVSYVSVDLDSPLASVRADITALPFADGSFDLLLCSHVLEHVADDQRAIAELYRVLRPGGTALIQVPPDPVPRTIEDPSVTDPRRRQRLFDQYDHVRLCGPDYGLRISAAGFGVTACDPVAGLDAGARAELGLRVGEPFYRSVKPGRARKAGDAAGAR